MSVQARPYSSEIPVLTMKSPSETAGERFGRLIKEYVPDNTEREILHIALADYVDELSRKEPLNV